MASKSDHELVIEMRGGRRNALGELFDRYSPVLYEFIYRIVGDRDQTARLLEEVFARVPAGISTLDDHLSVRGWLYGLAREISLGFLRQKSWLDALPPSTEPSVSGLAGDIWRAARSIPAFHRAVLVVEEMHGLSPTEKAHALGIARTDFPRLLEEARRLFSTQFDSQARQQGRPFSTQIDPERIWGMHRRLGSAGSLFGYLPAFVLPDSLAATVCARVLAAAPPSAAERVTLETVPAEEPAPLPEGGSLFEGCAWQWIGAALLVALAIIAIALGIGYLVTRDATAPVISQIEPPQDAMLPYNPSAGTTLTRVTLRATYFDDRAVDLRLIKLVVDGRDVTQQSVIGDTATSFTADFESGRHVVLIEMRDTAGNKTSRAWQFIIGNAPEATVAPTGTPTITATLQPTRTPSATGTATMLPPPIITMFTASPTVITRGAPSLLQWNVSNADQVFLNQDKVDPASSRLVAPASTTTYYLIANNAGGTTSLTITVVVQDLPDLTVTDIILTPNNQIIYTVRNIGGGDVTRSFLIQVTVGNVVVESDLPVSSLPSQQEARLVVPNYTLLGTQSVSVNVNLLQEVPETNYNNNVLLRTLIGPTPTPTVVQDLPDLTVTDISLTSNNQIIYTVRNIGGGDVSRTFVIQVTVGYGVVESDRPLSSLLSQQEARLIVPNFALQGAQSVSVNVNLLQEVQESNYNNNILVRTLVGPTRTPTSTPTLTPTPTPTNTRTNTPTPSNTPPGIVTSANAIVNPVTHTGACPATFYFAGTITMDGPGAVTYRWVRSDGTLKASHVLTFSTAGSQMVTDQWASIPASTTNGWQLIHVGSPNILFSNQATFTNSCH